MKPTYRTQEKLFGVVACEHDLLDIISQLVMVRGSQKAVADELGVSKAHLGDILHGKKAIGPTVADKLGWKRMTVFMRKNDEKPDDAFLIPLTAVEEDLLARAVERDEIGRLHRFVSRFSKLRHWRKS